MTRFAFSLALALTFITAAFAQRPGNFSVVGPGGGGAMFRPVVSPLDPNTVLVACDMTGRSEEHTSELQSRRYISYAVFCLKKKFF